MSESETEALPAIPRSMGESVGYRPDVEMSAIGLAIGGGIAILLIPLLPFLAAVWLLSKLLEAGRDRAT